ncbi:MAG: hypothetical protein ABI197_05350 [Granulicella sp.]
MSSSIMAMTLSRHAVASMKSVVVDLSVFDWEGDMTLNRPFRGTVIYEMHVAGFTRHPGAGIAPDQRETYLGFIDKIPYLQALGITAVELMPIFQFDSQDAVPDIETASELRIWVSYAPSDVTLSGTVNYIAHVIEEFATGRKPKSILNTPQELRRALRA